MDSAGAGPAVGRQRPKAGDDGLAAVHADLVAPAVLGGVERLVGAVEDALVVGVPVAAGHAYAQRHLDAAVVRDGDLGLFHAAADLLGDLPGLGLAYLGQHDQKLFAPVAGHEVGRAAQHRAQGARHGLQALIAHLVAVAVIELFEQFCKLSLFCICIRKFLEILDSRRLKKFNNILVFPEGCTTSCALLQVRQ